MNPRKPQSQILKGRLQPNRSGGGAFPEAHPLSRPRILIILMGSLGDVVRALCLPGAIKKQWPKASISWLVEPGCAELVASHPQVDETIIFDRPKKIKGFWALFQNLKQRDFDISLDLQRHLKSGFFGLLAAAPRRIGFHHKNAKELNWLFQTERLAPESDQLSKLIHYTRFLDALGLEKLDGLDFGLNSLALEDLEQPLRQCLKKPYLALVLGSSWPSKEWPFSCYLQLMRLLLQEEDLQLVLLDVPSKKDLARQLEDHLASDRVCNLVGQTSLLELAAILKGAELAIGPDCGPGHLAAAVGTAYISLFGPTSAFRTAPYGNLNLVCEVEMDCRPCYKRRCPKHDRPSCLQAIAPDQVLALTLRTLGRP